MADESPLRAELAVAQQAAAQERLRANHLAEELRAAKEQIVAVVSHSMSCVVAAGWGSHACQEG